MNSLLVDDLAFRIKFADGFRTLSLLVARSSAGMRFHLFSDIFRPGNKLLQITSNIQTRDSAGAIGLDSWMLNTSPIRSYWSVSKKYSDFTSERKNQNRSTRSHTRLKQLVPLEFALLLLVVYELI